MKTARGLQLSDVLKEAARLWHKTLPLQLILFIMYSALLALLGWMTYAGTGYSEEGVLELAFFPQALAVFVITALPYVIGGMMAHPIGLMLRGAPHLEVSWARLGAIVWASGLLAAMFWLFLSALIVPGYLALAAMWPWSLVAACEPEARGFRRSRELTSGHPSALWLIVAASALTAPLTYILLLCARLGVLGAMDVVDLELTRVVLISAASHLGIFLLAAAQGVFFAVYYHRLRTR